jgi:CheY-like chemotaxis protein
MASVLLVEDDEETRAALKELLETNGFPVSEAVDGQDALHRLVSSQKPALIILDLEMPIMSGPELLEVMGRYYRLSRVPVLIVTGSSQTPPQHEAVVGVLSKPCDVDALLRSVRTHVAAA